MGRDGGRRRWTTPVATGAGVVCATLGLIVLAGWSARSVGLVQLHPAFGPMLLALTVYLAQRAWSRAKEAEAANHDLGREIAERTQAEATLARLASFPEQNPHPVIELDPAGTVTYCNPAAQRQFPDLQARGLDHPLLQGLRAIIAALQNGEYRSLTREVVLGTAVYDQRICHLSEGKLIRVFAYDVTERTRAEEALRVRARQQAAVADLGQQALAGAELATLLDEAAALVARTLEVE